MVAAVCNQHGVIRTSDDSYRTQEAVREAGADRVGLAGARIEDCHGIAGVFHDPKSIAAVCRDPCWGQ